MPIGHILLDLPFCGKKKKEKKHFCEIPKEKQHMHMKTTLRHKTQKNFTFDSATTTAHSGQYFQWWLIAVLLINPSFYYSPASLCSVILIWKTCQDCLVAQWNYIQCTTIFRGKTIAPWWHFWSLKLFTRESKYLVLLPSKNCPNTSPLSLSSRFYSNLK